MIKYDNIVATKISLIISHFIFKITVEWSIKYISIPLYILILVIFCLFMDVANFCACNA